MSVVQAEYVVPVHARGAQSVNRRVPRDYAHAGLRGMKAKYHGSSHTCLPTVTECLERGKPKLPHRAGGVVGSFGLNRHRRGGAGPRDHSTFPLANNISLDEAARVIEQLEANNIPYEKSFSMSTILVPEAYWNDARIAARDVIGDTETTDWTASQRIAVR